MNYELHDGQLCPKDEARWKQMIVYHKQAGKSFPEIPAEQWYYFYIMGLEQGKLDTGERIFDKLYSQMKKDFELVNLGNWDKSWIKSNILELKKEFDGGK